DACDKLRYEALTKPELLDGGGEFKIEIALDAKAKTLTISDNGVGMNKEDLVDALGTIARSGTQAFMQSLKDAAGKDGKGGKDAGVQLIGQFGVGFYSAFMVADSVEVTSRRAGEDTAWRWTSDGRGSFEIEPATRAGRGTDVTLHLKKDAAKEYLEALRVENIVKRYSDHIAVPVILKRTGKDGTDKTLNSASAIWTRDKKDITAEQYAELYHHVGMAYDEPWMTIHNKVEGVVSYTNLLFIPTERPFNLFHPDRKGAVKLYVKRVFITDDCEALVPAYLRFLKGVVDSEDIDLNVSREMLQQNPALKKIKSGLVKRVLGELAKKAEKEPEQYATFWDAFGMVLKEGLHEDADNREKLLELTRFRSSGTDGWTSLADYVSRMKDGQEAIYYITGEDSEQVAKSPQLEGFRAKGIEVIYMTDPVDEFWLTSIEKYQEKSFKSATRGGIDLAKIKGADGQDGAGKKNGEAEKTAAGLDVLIAAFKAALGDKVKDVRTSDRLTESPVCLVADDHGLDMHLERLLKQHKQIDGLSARVLEINPTHGLITRLAGIAEAKPSDPVLEDAALLLLDQARIVEGEPVLDPQAFTRRMSSVMQRGLAG
ncbi:MAG: molecular chaperone HtpG, partial [Proteobacteria bacterium]|nr:molecular chaperone HtpG [Pseudomonadota bacterium]